MKKIRLTIDQLAHKGYRALVIGLITAVVLAVGAEYAPLNKQLLYAGALVGFMQVLTVRLVGNLSLLYSQKGRFHKNIALLFAPQPGYSLALMFSSVVSFTLLLLYFFSAGNWLASEVMQLGFAFLGGSAFGFIAYELLGYQVNDLPIQYKIDPDRYDSFAAAFIVATFTGLLFIELPDRTTMFNGLGSALLVASFSICSLLLSYLAAMLMELYGRDNLMNRMLISATSAFLLLIAANVVVNTFLPYHWLLDGTEHYAVSVKLAMHAGIIAGAVSGLAVAAYKVVAKQYLNLMLKARRPFFAVYFTSNFLINGLFALLPLAVVAMTVIYAYQLVGIYTASLAMLCMVSNVGVHLLITENYLKADNWQNFSYGERRKIKQLSPSWGKVRSAMNPSAKNAKRKSNAVA